MLACFLTAFFANLKYDIGYDMCSSEWNQGNVKYQTFPVHGAKIIDENEDPKGIFKDTFLF